MKLLKPKRPDTVSEEYAILKSSRLILELYSKYTNYPEGEVLDHFLLEILKEDTDFVEWISEQRSIKKFLQSGLLKHLTVEQQRLFENHTDEVLEDEPYEEAWK